MSFVSIGGPLTRAWARMLLVCFQPFDLVKWLKLGFCAWLATLGEGGGSFNSPGSHNSGSSGSGGGMGEAGAWIEEYLILIIAAAVVLFLIITAILLVLAWLKARGTFMFIDGIARNRGAVIEPWKAHSSLGNNLFVVRTILSVLALFLGILILGLGAALAYVDIVAKEFGVMAIVAIIVSIGLFAVVAVVFGTIKWVLDQLVVPTMYATRGTVGQAWSQVRAEIMAPYLGAVVLFWLARLGVGIVVAIVALIAILMTCCVGLLPYTGAVILLPLSVLMKSWSMYFVDQFGESFRIFPEEEAGARAGQVF